MKLLQPETIQKSVTYSFVQPWGPKAINGLGSVIPVFKNMFGQTGKFFFLSGVSEKFLEALSLAFGANVLTWINTIFHEDPLQNIFFFYKYKNIFLKQGLMHLYLP